MDLPILANFDLIAEGFTFPFQWNSQHQARLGIMDRKSTTDTVKWIDIDPCFVFHPMNSYALQAGGKHGFGGLLKHDLEKGTTERHDIGDNCAGGEPVFVSSGDAEDEGYVLSVVYDGATELSEVRIIDAPNFASDPVAIIKLNARVPFGFHGNFIVGYALVQ